MTQAGMTQANHGRGERQCTATRKTTGARCGNSPILGGTVCRYHGGGAPQVKARARERLLAMVDPALTELSRLLRKSKLDPVRMAAVKDVLDRAGFRPIEEVDVTISNIISTLQARIRRIDGPDDNLEV